MISFIIPAFNEEKLIGKLLELLSNYHGDHEIIVSDDNSTDTTVDIARKYTDKVVLNQSGKRGVAANRNRGAKIARGEYLVFIDADMFLNNPDAFFKKTTDVFLKNKDIVALTVFIRIFKDMETFADKIVMRVINYLNLIMNNFLGIGAASGEFQMMRADAFRKVDGFNENLVAGEDNDMFRRLTKVGRTYSEKSLAVFNDGRRPHKVGWPKLLCIWTGNTIWPWIFGKSKSKIWTEIR